MSRNEGLKLETTPLQKRNERFPLVLYIIFDARAKPKGGGMLHNV